MTYPALLYLQPKVAEFFGFASWKFTKEQSIVVAPLPVNVYGWLETANLGLFARLSQKMLPLLMKRYFCIFILIKFGSIKLVFKAIKMIYDDLWFS